MLDGRPEEAEAVVLKGFLNMSTLFVFPKPKDWDTFEDIVCDLIARGYSNRNLQRYGRRGQKQSGVDIAGHTHEGLLGVQCKHHPTGNIPTAEIDSEIAKSEGFKPELDKFFIVTSADRDAAAHAHVLQVTKDRTSKEKYPVVILFWDDICSWMVEFPDLIYKHFTKHFPIQVFEEIRLSQVARQRIPTVQWPTTFEELWNSIQSSTGSIKTVEPYKLTLGFTTFPDVSYKGEVDLELNMAHLFTDEASSQTNFARASKDLAEIRAILGNRLFSKELWIHLQARLTSAFLLGWVFRRVTHFELRLIFANQVWATSGLPLVPSGITDDPPILIDPDSDEVVLILNITRSIESSAISFVRQWEARPQAILVYELEGRRITSAAHAQSIALEVSRRVKNLVDRWHVRKIHLFGAMPAALATLISFNLNAICPILLYYFDSTRTQYKLGGTLSNET